MNKALKHTSLIVIIILLLFLICGTAYIIAKSFNSSDTSTNNKNYRIEYARKSRDTKITIDKQGDISITRDKLMIQNQNSKNETWTILMYLCGSNMESNDGYSSKVLDSISNCSLDSNGSKNFNFLVQTGGTKKWQTPYEYISTDALERRLLKDDGSWELVDSKPLASMGDPYTLSDFINWGLKTYPADRTILILNGYGSSSINGICFDELHQNDSLSCGELEYALSTSTDSMKNAFDYIIFDTSSSATLEYLNSIACYADYAFATPYTMLPLSYNYKVLFNKIIQNPSITNNEIGALLSKEYYNYAETSASKYNISKEHLCVAAFELEQLDALLIEFNNLLKSVYNEAKISPTKFVKYNKAILSAYKHNSQHYDIKNVILALAKVYTKDTKNELSINSFNQALDKLVISKVNSTIADKNNCALLSFFYDFDTPSSYTYDRVRNMTVSPYHLMMQELSGYMTMNNNFKNFRSYDWTKSNYFYENTFDFLNYRYYLDTMTSIDVLSSNHKYVADGFIQKWIDNVPTKNTTDREPSNKVTTSVDKSRITHSLKDMGNYVTDVYNTVYIPMNNSYACLGEYNNGSYDFENNTVETNFKGQWITLKDSQPLTCYITHISNERTIYLIPVLHNDVESSIIVSINEENICTIEGLQSSTIFDKYTGYIKPLCKDDKIRPIYYIWNDKNNTYESKYGSSYTFKDNKDIIYNTLKDSNKYQYSSVIKNSFSNKLYSDKTYFSIKKRKIVYNAS